MPMITRSEVTGASRAREARLGELLQDANMTVVTAETGATSSADRERDRDRDADARGDGDRPRNRKREAERNGSVDEERADASSSASRDATLPEKRLASRLLQ